MVTRLLFSLDKWGLVSLSGLQKGLVAKSEDSSVFHWTDAFVLLFGHIIP